MKHYRNGTYVAFAADGQSDPTKSDIKFYYLLQGWRGIGNREFTFINSHRKVSAVKDTSLADTVKRSLRERLKMSKNMLLLVGNTTRFDDDFVPYEINYAVKCGLPIIVCYVHEKQRIVEFPPKSLTHLLPDALIHHMSNGNAKTLHIPFKEKIIRKAIDEISVHEPLTSPINWFRDSVYDNLYI